MANETVLTAGLTNSKNGQISASTTATISQSGVTNLDNVQQILTTTVPITLGGVTGSLGYVYAKNLDTGNYVTLSLVNPVVSGTAFSILQPGEALVMPCRATGFFGLANSAPLNLQVVAVSL